MSEAKTYIHLVNLESIIDELVMDKFGCLSVKIATDTARELGEWLLEECGKVVKQ